MTCNTRREKSSWLAAGVLHLPDWAVIRYDADRFTDDRSGDTIAAGFFNERWEMLWQSPPPGR
jgi:hypothetical protein